MQKKKIKIIHIIPNLKKGGAERLVQDICENIFKSNLAEVKLITFLKENFNSPFHLNIPSYYKPSITSKSKLKINELQEFIDFYKPDIIHSHLWETEILLTKINTRKAIRFTHFHDNIYQLKNKFIPKNKIELTNKFEKKLFLKKNTNKFICVSNDTYKYAIKVLPKKHIRNINLLPNSIDFKKFHNCSEFNLNKINLINIGSFVPKKNQLFALKILKSIYRKGHNVKLTFLGDGPLKNMVENEAKILKLDHIIEFKGNVENIQIFLNKSNIYLHTAKYEPFGLVLLEAMAAGLPVVSLDGRGNRDIITNNENGIIIENENIDLFANKIITLIKNENYYNKIRNNGYETAKKYDIIDYVDLLLENYFSAIK